MPACYCPLVTPVTPTVALLILQHPLEVRHAKNSGRLLHLCLPGSTLLVGEQFDHDALHGALHADGLQPLLLYPATPGGLIPEPPAFDVAALPAAGPALRLVVLDATWDKSLKMLLRNPLLKSLPRLALDAMPPSTYAIRKAPRPGRLSTLEASCHALARLEGAPERYRPVLQAFDAFVARRLAFAHRQ